MMRLGLFIALIIFAKYNSGNIVSYNRPKLSPCASWNSSGMKYGEASTIGREPDAIFVNTNNIVYVVGRTKNEITIWSGEKPKLNGSIYAASNREIFGVFVDINGDVYFGANDSNEVYKKLPDGVYIGVLKSRKGNCYGLFIDINNTLYCSMQQANQIAIKSLYSDNTAPFTYLGTDSSGSNANQFDDPRGIFVDESLRLYVADRGNNRIQCFEFNKSNGTTVVGKGTGTIELSEPTAVVLDADANLFIVDSENHRVVRSGPNGSCCVVGCNDTDKTKMTGPRMLSFDSYGNIFVTDKKGHQVYKFFLASNSCDSTPSSQSIATTSIVPTTTKNSTYSSQMQITTTLTNIESTTTTLANTQSTTIANNVSTVSHSITQLSSTTPPPFFSTSPTRNTSSSTDPDPPCNISNIFCSSLDPCQHGGTCVINQSDPDGYTCECSLGFDGDRCERDIRPCKPDTCWNDGVCLNTSMTEFYCNCSDGWTGIRCGTMIDYCHNVVCQNQGVCRPLLLDYRCECSTSSYSGRHCEIIDESLIARKIASKSLAFVAIICICMVLGFVVVMDALKYIFHIDPVRGEREQLRREQMAKKKKKPVIIRFKYVDHPPAITITEETV